MLPELDPSHYGLDAGSNVELQGIMNMGKSTAKVEEVLSALEQTYCGPIGVEFQHLQVGIPFTVYLYCNNAKYKNGTYQIKSDGYSR